MCALSKAYIMKPKSVVRLSLFLSVCALAYGNSAMAGCTPDQYCPERYNNSAREGVESAVVPRVERGAAPIAKSAPIEVQSVGIFELLQEGRVHKYKLQNLDGLREFYKARNFQPYWVSRGRPNDDAQEMLDMIQNSWTHGLNPYSYQYDTIAQLYERDGDDAAMFAMDVLLTEAYIEYGQDLTGIRVNPATLKSNKKFWQQPLTTQYLLSLLGRNDIDDVVASFAPRGGTYNRLRKELITLVNEEPEPYEGVLPIRVKGAIHPYEQHQAVRDLRIRFGVGGDSLVYDDALAARVMAFQAANGLKADGIVGPATLGAINKNRRGKIHQVIANLERLRWVPENKPDKFVIVNVPSAMLWAVENGRVAFDMPVIVGRKERPTNIFITEITGVRLNPTWTVPPTIKKEDILPKLREDGGYLESKGMELTHGLGSDALTLDPNAIDWSTVTEDELRTLRMVQVPGAHNPLGSYRVLMPNSYNIYLHDTNEPHYFDTPGRAISSGCVRMKRPREMADFILREKRGWTPEKTQNTLDTAKLHDLYVQNVIPVYIVYYTAWVDDGGEVVLGNDLYGYDDEIIKMLTNLDEIFIPVDNT